MACRFEYSAKYTDGEFEYKHVTLPKELASRITIPMSRFLSEAEWRELGVMQTQGWVHFAWHKPEPYVLLFKRPLGCDGATGRVNPQVRAAAQEKYLRSMQGKVADPSHLQALAQQFQREQEQLKQQQKAARRG